MNTLVGGAGKLGGGQKSFEAPKRGGQKVSNPKRGVKKVSNSQTGGQKSLNMHRFSKFSGATPRTPIEVAPFFYIHSSAELEHF